MVIKAVFFDFDGTISDARGIALKSLVRTFDDFGYEVDERKITELIGTRFSKMLKMLGVREADLVKMRKKFYGYFIKGAVEGRIKPCVSLKPLWKMKEEGMPLTVVSNSRSKFLYASVKVLEIEGLFDRIFGAEKFERKDEMLRILFKRMKISPEEAVYVGDRFSDVEAAKRAGCVSVAVHNKCSWSTLDKIVEEGPDFIVRDFYGLRRVLKKLNGL